MRSQRWGAAEHAAVIADELEHYRAQRSSSASPSTAWERFDRYRGMVLMVQARHDEAVEALTAALDLEESIDTPPLAVRTRYWLAGPLLRRNGPGGRQRAGEGGHRERR